MTVGEYIKKLLCSRNVSLTKLSEDMGLTSRNTLYRLFSGYHSYEMQKKLIGEIIDNVDFTNAEINKIYKLLDEYKIGEFYVQTNKILFNIYKPIEKSFALNDKTKLSSLLQTRYLDDSITVIMSKISDEKIISDVYNLLKKYSDKVTVYNYLFFPRHNTLSAYEILALIRLSEFENYIPIFMNEDVCVPSEFCLLSKNYFGWRMHKIEFVDNVPMYLETDITKAVYDYEMKKYISIAALGVQLKCRIKKIGDYIKILTDIGELDKGGGFFSEGGPCFGYLPANMLCDMFESIDFFGFSKESSYVVNLMNLVKEKEKNIINSKDIKRMLFEESVVEEIMRTGISVDHAKEFPPMTTEQRKEYFKNIIEIPSGESNVQIRIAKNLSVKSSFVYVENSMLYIYRSKTGYTDGCEIILKSKSINEIMKKFADYIWENYTLPDEESKAVIKRLMDTVLCE